MRRPTTNKAMPNKTDKARGWLSRFKIAVAVGRTVMTGKSGKTLDRLASTVPIAEQALIIADLVKDLKKK